MTYPHELGRRALRLAAEVRDDRPSEHLATTAAARMLGIRWLETILARIRRGRSTRETGPDCRPTRGGRSSA